VTILDEPFQIALLARRRQVRVKHTYSTSVDPEPSGPHSVTGLIAVFR
jgi:hypothetical protein